jgi:hypothetical protein
MTKGRKVERLQPPVERMSTEALKKERERFLVPIGVFSEEEGERFLALNRELVKRGESAA